MQSIAHQPSQCPRSSPPFSFFLQSLFLNEDLASWERASLELRYVSSFYQVGEFWTIKLPLPLASLPCAHVECPGEEDVGFKLPLVIELCEIDSH